MHDEGCKNLSEVAAPGDSGSPGRRCWLVLLLFLVLERPGKDIQFLRAKGKGREKDADSTSKLGVSDS